MAYEPWILTGVHTLCDPCCRPREAIECLKRALIGADPLETTIHLRLAKLYHDLCEYEEAANYHRHVVQLCMSASKHPPITRGRVSTDWRCVADKPVIEYARSAVHVARYHLLQGGGDLELAKEYMEKVASSNAEEVREATDLLKKIKLALSAKQEADAAMGTSGAASA